MSTAHLAALVLGTVIADGFVFSRLPGASPFFSITKTPEKAALCGIFVTLCMVMASAAAWPLALLFGLLQAEYLHALMLVCAVCLIAMVIDLALKKLPGSLKNAIGIPPLGIAVNSAVLGGALIVTHSAESFAAALSAAAGSGLGFTLAAVIFAGVRGRVTLASDCPNAMEGLPIALVTAGLLALVFSGFSGLKI